MGGGGDEGKQQLCTENGPLIVGSPFKILFFPRGIFFPVLGVWVVWPAGGGGPDPRNNQHNPNTPTIGRR